jgi:anti-anti-sigma factor
MNTALISTPNGIRDSHSSITTVAVSCELVRGTEDRILNKLMPRVRQESIALDLSGVERIDAAGIAALITLYCTAIESGTAFYVVSPSARVLDLLRLVGLESILVPAGNATEPSAPRLERLEYDLSAA